jgi:hypothetical protein
MLGSSPFDFAQGQNDGQNGECNNKYNCKCGVVAGENSGREADFSTALLTMKL